jgi:hypothetical protein
MIYYRQTMTNFSIKPPQTISEPNAFSLAKEQRKKQLEEVRKRRAMIYKRMRNKHIYRQDQGISTNPEYPG